MKQNSDLDFTHLRSRSNSKDKEGKVNYEPLKGKLFALHLSSQRRNKNYPR